MLRIVQKLAYYTQDLVADLESETRGKFERVVLSLMDPPMIYMANELQRAMKGIGADCDVITEVKKYSIKKFFSFYSQNVSYELFFS